MQDQCLSYLKFLVSKPITPPIRSHTVLLNKYLIQNCISHSNVLRWILKNGWILHISIPTAGCCFCWKYGAQALCISSPVLYTEKVKKLCWFYTAVPYRSLKKTNTCCSLFRIEPVIIFIFRSWHYGFCRVYACTWTCSFCRTPAILVSSSTSREMCIRDSHMTVRHQLNAGVIYAVCPL